MSGKSPLGSVVVVLHSSGHRQPGMSARLVDRDCGRRERWIGKSTDRDSDHVRHRGQAVVHRRAAFRAEVECSRVAVVGDANIFCGAPLDADSVTREARLDAERAPRAALAREAVTHRDSDRLPLRCQLKLPTAASGAPRDHLPTVPCAQGSSRRPNVRREHFAGAVRDGRLRQRPRASGEPGNDSLPQPDEPA
jgi:hypothetical protein